ncbi:hypothetical protein EON65_58570 [archaeon]|nr:MAG: hypothetical protein EON65_58570 [archaeon]
MGGKYLKRAEQVSWEVNQQPCLCGSGQPSLAMRVFCASPALVLVIPYYVNREALRPLLALLQTLLG